jgi:hypothetical protein
MTKKQKLARAYRLADRFEKLRTRNPDAAMRLWLMLEAMTYVRRPDYWSAYLSEVAWRTPWLLKDVLESESRRAL